MLDNLLVGALASLYEFGFGIGEAGACQPKLFGVIVSKSALGGKFLVSWLHELVGLLHALVSLVPHFVDRQGVFFQARPGGL